MDKFEPLMLRTLNDIAAGRSPKSPEPMQSEPRNTPRLRTRLLDSQIMRAVAVGFICAGIGFGMIAACSSWTRCGSGIWAGESCRPSARDAPIWRKAIS